MREDVFSAALKATARVAFSVALASGCSSAEESASTGSNESEVKTGARRGEPAKPAEPCTKDAGAEDAAVTPTCGEQLDALDAAREEWMAKLTDHFNDGGTTKDGPKSPVVSADAKQCCVAELTADGFEAAHQQVCCRLAISWEESLEIGGAVAMACTPWGPPVPPAMTVLA